MTELQSLVRVTDRAEKKEMSQGRFINSWKIHWYLKISISPDLHNYICCNNNYFLLLYYWPVGQREICVHKVSVPSIFFPYYVMNNYREEISQIENRVRINSFPWRYLSIITWMTGKQREWFIVRGFHCAVTKMASFYLVSGRKDALSCTANKEKSGDNKWQNTASWSQFSAAGWISWVLRWLI